MNIALFTDTFSPKYDGTQKVVKSLATEYSLLGHRVVVVAPDYGRDNIEDLSEPFKIIRLKSKPSSGGHYRVSRFGHLVDKIKIDFDKLNFRPDIIHSFSPNEVGYAGIKLAKKNSIKSILTMDTKFSYVFHRDIPFSKKNFIHKLIFRLVLHINTIPESIRKCDKLLTVSTSYYNDEIVNEYNVKKDFTCIKNGIELNEIPRFNFNKHAFSQDVITLCYAGRIDKVKNIDFSLRVCEILDNNNIPYVFKLAGDGPYLQFCKKWVIKHKMEEKVLFLGKMNLQQLIELYSSSDCLLFPSIYDNDSLVAIESRFCGCLTLAIKDTATSERIIDGINGFNLENNPDSFANKIEELFLLKHNDLKEFISLKNNTAETPIKKWNQVAVEHIDFYNK